MAAPRMYDTVIDEALRAVADPTRRAILRLVREGELAAGEIAAHFPSISRPAVSQHLRVLDDAGLVTVRREGNRRLYRWRREGFRDAATYVQEMWADRLDRLKVAAERDEWPERTRARLVSTREETADRGASTGTPDDVRGTEHGTGPGLELG